MARYIFDELGYRRLEWKCNNLNEPSRNAAKRFGFAFEGIFRQHMVVKGLNRDTAWFAMTDADWVLLKPRYAAWLSLSNFDENGKQRTSRLRKFDFWTARLEDCFIGTARYDSKIQMAPPFDSIPFFVVSSAENFRSLLGCNQHFNPINDDGQDGSAACERN